MTTRKKIIIVVTTIITLFLVWYLAIKKSDYCISFTVKAATGTVYQGVQEWAAARLIKNNEKYIVIEKQNFDFIKLEMIKEEVWIDYTWTLASINDSVTKVSVGIKDYNNSFYNKLSVPFFNTDFKKEQIKKIADFKTDLQDHLKNFKVKINGKGASEISLVAYISLKSVLQEKAQKMISSDAIITGFLASNNIKIKGRPYLEITKWDFNSEIIEFNYCFPIDKSTKIIFDEVVKFKTLPVFEGLKATYYGNFRTSDKAWFVLIDYAKKQNIKLDNRVLEHFLSNPFNGGEEIKWKTEIIMPISSH